MLGSGPWNSALSQERIVRGYVSSSSISRFVDRSPAACPGTVCWTSVWVHDQETLLVKGVGVVNLNHWTTKTQFHASGVMKDLRWSRTTMKITAHHPFRSAKAKDEYIEFNERRAEDWPVPCESSTVETAHGHTYVRVSGPAKAPPLVLLPGGGNHSLMWIPNIAGLSARFRTYAVDSILDVGRSANTRPIKTVEELTLWLDELLDALQLGASVRLMGLSHGGWLAANYAQRYPARIARLVLLAPVGWILQLRPAMLFSMMQMLLYPRRYFIRRAYLWSLPDLAESGDAGLKIIDEMTEDLALAFRCFGVRRLTQMLEPTVVDDETLRNLEVPTLFVIGEREKIYSCQEALERLERVAPSIATAVIPGAGHDMTWLKPDLVNREVLAFLDGQTTR